MKQLWKLLALRLQPPVVASYTFIEILVPKLCVTVQEQKLLEGVNDGFKAVKVAGAVSSVRKYNSVSEEVIVVYCADVSLFIF